MHLTYPDYLSALLTADKQIRPDDSRYHFREKLRESFAEWGIYPAGVKTDDGTWTHAEDELEPNTELAYDRTHFEAMMRDPDEVFRFLWEDRRALDLFEGAYTQVLSVRPCLRVDPLDGFYLRETVAECMQLIKVRASELQGLGIEKPPDMDNDQVVALEGGVTLLFDEYGKLKFAISNHLHSRQHVDKQTRQSERLQYLWEHGYFRKNATGTGNFASMHRMKAAGHAGFTQFGDRFAKETW